MLFVKFKQNRFKVFIKNSTVSKAHEKIGSACNISVGLELPQHVLKINIFSTYFFLLQ